MKSLGLALLFVILPTVAWGQAFGTGPIKDLQTGDIVQQGGGFNRFNGLGTRFEATHNPKTGRFERRSVTVSPMSNRVIEREQSYDPKTGDLSARAVHRDMWTGQTIEARRTRNSFTGEGEQVVGMTNPVTGQSYGFARRTLVDPYTGTRRRDIGQFNTFLGAPNGSGAFSSTTIYNPYTGQVMQGSPQLGVWPR